MKQTRILLLAAALLVALLFFFVRGTKDSATAGHTPPTPAAHDILADRAADKPALPATVPAVGSAVGSVPAAGSAVQPSAAFVAGPASTAPVASVEPDRWQQAPVIDQRETSTPDGRQRVTVKQPADLPFPARIQETLAPDGGVIARKEMVANRIIVRPEPDGEQAFLAAVATAGASAKKIGSALYRVTLPTADADAVPRALEAFPGLRYAEPDYIVHALLTPDDPKYLDGTLWGLHNTGQNSGLNDADIDAPEGWDVRTSAPDVVVGLIDTGVRYTHEDIAANMWVNAGETGIDSLGRDKRSNGLDDDGNGYIDDVHGINAITGSGNPLDDQGHGSHCAGSIAGVGNNGKGVAGVAWNTKVMALKFLSSSGSGALSDAIICLDYAVANGATLTSNSWGGGDFTQSLHDAIAAARDAGQLFIAAAANDASNNDILPVYPATYALENIISVAALDRADALASFSNYGSGTVEIGGPGVSIYSLGHTGDSDYKTLSGTSMATPHVAGLAALAHAQFPASDFMGVKNRILRGGRPVASIQGKTVTGRSINVPGTFATATDAPINDDFADAIAFTSDPQIIRANNVHASVQPGEPLHAGHNTGSIWFRHTATVSGTTVFTSVSSTIDTTLAVYTGASVDALSLVGQNDDSAEGTLTSRVQIQAVAGTTYHVAVAGKNGAAGFVRASVAGPPKEDAFANAAALPSFPFSYQSNNSNGSREAGEPLHAGQPGGGSLWLKFSAAAYNLASQRIVLTTRNSSFDTLLAVYRASTPAPAFGDLIPVVSNDDAAYGNTQSEVSFTVLPDTYYFIAIDGKNGARGTALLAGFFKTINDDFAEAIALSGSPVSLTTPPMDLYNGTREPGEPAHDNSTVGKTLWYSWTAPASGNFTIRTDANTAMGVYTGESVNALTLVAGDENTGNTVSYAVLSATAGTTYRIALDTRGALTILPPVTLTIEPHTPAAHDNAAQAFDLVGTPSASLGLRFEGDNLNATLESGEPVGPGEMTRSIWIKWTAPVSGTFAADTHYSKINTSLAVYRLDGTDPAYANLVYLAGNKDGGIDDDGWLTFSATAGTTYYFQIGGATTADEGLFIFNLNPFIPPPNDNLANATLLDNLVVQREVFNFGATREAGEPSHAANDAHHNNYTTTAFDPTDTAYNTLWFKWTPTAAQAGRRTSASAHGSNMRAVVAVYETTVANPGWSDLTQVTPGSSKWYGPGSSPWWGWGEVIFTPQLGKTYYIMLGVDYAENEIQRLSLWQNPNDNFANRTVLPSTGDIRITDANFAATRETGEPKLVNNGGRSLWYQWTAPETGRYVIDTFESYLVDRFTALGMRDDGYNNIHMQLGIYTGSAVNALTKISAIRDLSMRNYNAMLSLDAVAGQTYQIVVDTEVGPNWALNTHKSEWCYRTIFNLNLTKAAGRLANDNLADAKRVTPGHAEFIDLKFATRQAGEPTHGSRATRSAWWKWTAPASGTYWAATTTDIFDSQRTAVPGIGIYSGPEYNASFASLVSRAQNTGGGSTGYYPARASFTATAGTTYYFAVDLGSGSSDYNGCRTGFSLVAPAPNDNFANATVITGSRRTVTGHNLSATQETNEPIIDPDWIQSGASQSSVWWRWTAPASGSTTVTTRGSKLNPELAVYTGPALTSLNLVAREISGTLFENGFTYEERIEYAERNVTFNAVAGTTYHILVTGSGYDKQSRGPITIALTGQPGAPLAPTDFRAVRAGENRVNLAWTDEAVDESGYVIQRATSPTGPWTAVFSSGEPDTTAWSDLDASGTWHYRVRAEGPGGQSDWVAVSTDDNHAPDISAIADQIIPLNGNSGPIAFTIGDDRTDPDSLLVTATSGNATRIPNSGLVLGGSGANRTLTISPAAGQAGATPITVSVNDGTHTTQQTFTVIVSDLNTPVAASILLTPVSVLLEPGAALQYSAVLRDQWGLTMNPQPGSFTWDVSAPAGGSINATGLLTAGTTPGTYQVTATSGSVTRSASFSIFGESSGGSGTFSDSFNDGVRTAGDDPADVSWLYQKTGTSLTIATGGGLTNALSFNSNNNAASFFAALPDTVTLANEGDYLEVSFKYARSATLNYSSGTRVGLFFQSGLPVADNYGTAVTPMWDMAGLDPAWGYLAGFPSGTSSGTNIRKDTNAAANNSTATTHNYLVHNQGDNTGILGATSTAAGLKLPAHGTVATIRLRVEKTAAGVRVTTGLTPDGGTETILERDDATSPFVTFNAVGFGMAAANQVNYWDDIAITTNVGAEPAPPSAPAGFTGSRQSASSVQLSWNAASGNLTSLVLERSTNNSTWTPLGTLPANTASHLDASAPLSDLYYRLAAVSDVGQGEWATVLVTLPPSVSAPTGLTGSATSMTALNLSWDAVPHADSLHLERSSTGTLGPWTVLQSALSGNTTTFSDTGLQGNKTYWYRLRGSNMLGNGPWSSVAAVSTINTATLVSDSFTDGGVTNGADPLDVAWGTVTAAHTVVTDSALDSGTPANALEASTTSTEGDVYAYFTLPGGNQTLAVGESLKLSFKVRHTGTPRTDDSRTGFSIAYTANNNPWNHVDNREYMVRTSYGSTGSYTDIVRTSGADGGYAGIAVNSNGTDYYLANNQPAVNAGTNTVAAWMEVARTGESTVVVRAQIGSNAIIETTDTGTANGVNVGVVTTFNRVFLRFRTVAGTTDPKFHVDDVVVTKTLSGTPEPSQHPITVWRQTYFGITTNTGLAADTADSDGDGIPNLLEHALGTSPVLSSEADMPLLDTTQVSGQDRLRLSFTPQETAGLRYIVQASTDLSNWSDQTDLTDLLVPGQTYLHTDSANLGTTTRRFLRLRVETINP